MAREPVLIRFPIPIIQESEALQQITEAIETSCGGSDEAQGPPPDDLMSLDHVETPRTEPVERKKYDRYMQPETHIRQKEGDGIDPDTGWRYEFWDIGMTRNARAESKKMMKVFLDPIPHVVLPSQHVPLRGWYKSKFEPSNIRPRPCFTDALLTQPYGGFCAVGCCFCYINNGSRGYRGQGVTVVDPTYPEKIAKQLTTMRTAAAVYMSSFIDPFLEVEEHYHNTERVARAVDAQGLPMFFLTRKQPPGWAFDLLTHNKYSYMQFSINTSDAADWRLLSPKAVSLPQQLDNVREMHRRGIYISIQVNPIIAGVTTNEHILKLIHDLAEAGANHLIFKFVEIVYPAVQGMVRQIKARFRERADAFEALFTQNIGGVRTIDEDYRIAALDLFKAECAKVGVTMSLCYEYVYERNPDGSIKNKTGVSIGRKYITGDQCHGHRVPMFSRRETTQPFEPIESCPPSGCLYCADDFGGETNVPCGNILLAKAPALLPPMLREPANTREHGGNPERLLPMLKIQDKHPGGAYS